MRGPPLPLRVPIDEIAARLRDAEEGTPKSRRGMGGLMSCRPRVRASSAKARDVDDVLLKWITHHFGERDKLVFADPESFGFSSLVLLLDGLDEAHAPIVVLEWLLAWSRSGRRGVVMTTRPSALGSDDVSQWFDVHNYRRMELLPFDEHDWSDLVRLRLPADDAQQILASAAAAGGDVDGRPWLWSLRLFLFSRGEQFWKSEPQIIRAAFFQLTSAVPEWRQEILDVLVQAYRNRSRTVKWTQLKPGLSNLAVSMLSGLLHPVQDKQTGDTNFQIVHQRFLEFVAAKAFCAGSYQLESGDEGIRELLVNMQPRQWWAHCGFGGFEWSTVEELRDVGFTAKTLAALGHPSFTVAQLLGAGFCLSELRDANFSLAEFRDAGMGFADLQKAGFTVAEVHDALRRS
mmetsp:Transcript_39110/g.102536  ORF Transcript_39110/g.102536 Transcript_39110/m.102536 type:complete len:403 (+) Transcript_39110:452-1660(+)